MDHPPRRIAATFFVLALGNLLIDGGVGWLLRSDDIQAAVFLVAVFLTAVGLLLGQTLLVAFWIAFSEERWYWHWVVPALLAAGTVAVCTIAAGLGLVESALAALAVQGLLWVLVALLMPLRRIRGWRLRRRESASSTDHGRFGVRDLLVWMMVIGVPLAIFRFLVPPGAAGTFTSALRVVAVLCCLLLPLLWLAILVAFSRGWQHSRWFLGGISVYACLATAIATREFYALVFDPFWAPRPGWVLLMQSIPFTALFFITSSLLVWLNCLGLRHAGWRLLRPL